MEYLLFVLLGIFCSVQQSLASAAANFPKECGTMPVVHSDYQPKGRDIMLNNMKIYETGRPNNDRVIIVVYDIFGFHPNTKQLADKVAEFGDFRLVMPDFYRSVPWDQKNFPPKNWTDLVNWVEVHGNWSKTIKPDIVNTIDHYKKESATSFGLFGFCWGGYISIEAGTELTTDVKAVGLVHPSFVEVPEAANRVKSAVIVLPSQNEPDYINFYKTVKGRLGEKNVETVRFDDMMHGFAAARGDLNNELVRDRVEQVIHLLIKFFNRHLPKSETGGTAAAKKNSTNRVNSFDLFTVYFFATLLLVHKISTVAF